MIPLTLSCMTSDSFPSHRTFGRVLVTLATYNERENLPDVGPAILRALPQADLLVVDDGSPDGTGTWCDEYSLREPRLAVIHRPRKLGLGTAYLVAMEYAKSNAYDWLITMDADGSHSPTALPAILARAGGLPPCDVVIGSRYVDGGRIDNWPWRRRLTSRLVNALMRWALPVGIHDYTSGFRAYRASILDPRVTAPPQTGGFGFLEELVARLRTVGARFAEVPITFVDRGKGRSKADLRECFAAARGVLSLLLFRSSSPASGQESE